MDSIRDKQGLAYGITSHYEARAMPGSFWINLQTNRNDEPGHQRRAV
jgi:zinc protease